MSWACKLGRIHHGFRDCDSPLALEFANWSPFPSATTLPLAQKISAIGIPFSPACSMPSHISSSSDITSSRKPNLHLSSGLPSDQTLLPPGPGHPGSTCRPGCSAITVLLGLERLPSHCDRPYCVLGSALWGHPGREDAALASGSPHLHGCLAQRWDSHI